MSPHSASCTIDHATANTSLQGDVIQATYILSGQFGDPWTRAPKISSADCSPCCHWKQLSSTDSPSRRHSRFSNEKQTKIDHLGGKTCRPNSPHSCVITSSESEAPTPGPVYHALALSPKPLFGKSQLCTSVVCQAHS